MLNFDGADLREVVKAIVGDLLNASYTIDPKVQGQINLHTSNPLHRKDLLPTLATLLRMNGAAILLEDGIYKIVPAATAARGSVSPQLGGDPLALPNGSGYGVQITPLKFIAAKEMLKLLERLLRKRVRCASMRRALYPGERELRHLQSTIAMFDRLVTGMSIGLFSSKRGGQDGGGGPDKLRRKAQPAGRGGQVGADQRLNSIPVITRPSIWSRQT